MENYLTFSSSLFKQLEKLPVNHIWERIQRRNLYHMVGHVTDTQITEGTDIKDLKKGLEDHLKDCNKNWDCPKSFEVFVSEIMPI